MNDLPIHMEVPVEADDAFIWLQLLHLPLALVAPHPLEHNLIMLIPGPQTSVMNSTVCLDVIAHREFLYLTVGSKISSQGLPLVVGGGEIAHED